MKERRVSMWVERPLPSKHSSRNTVVLTFLRETKVGRMIRLTPPEEGGGKGVEGGPGSPENVSFLCLCIFLVSHFFGGSRDVREAEAPL